MQQKKYFFKIFCISRKRFVLIIIFFKSFKFNQKMMRDQKDNSSDFFKDPKPNAIAYATFLSDDENQDELKIFSFIVDIKDKNQEKICLPKDQQMPSEKMSKNEYQKIGDEIFQVPEKKQKEEFKNLHKTLIRIFLKHFESFAKTQGQNPGYFMFMNNIQKEIKRIGMQNTLRQDLKYIFGYEKKSQQEDLYRQKNRYYLHLILSNRAIMKDEVIDCKYFKEKNKLKHLVGIKICKFRARSSSIVYRTQCN